LRDLRELKRQELKMQFVDEVNITRQDLHDGSLTRQGLDLSEPSNRRMGQDVDWEGSEAS
jgi:hypothetical protein